MERRNQIIAATLDVISTQGLSGLSIRAVAAQADIPLGAVGYYFKDKDELVRAAFERHVALETERVTRAITRLGRSVTSEELADGLCDFLVKGLSDHKSRLVAEYDFVVESSRKPDLASVNDSWQRTLLVQVQTVVGGLGSPTPQTDGRLILATLAGLEVDHLPSHISPADTAELRHVLHRLIGCLSATWVQAAGDAAPD